MSNHTKAWALTREVPDHELRTALLIANERILDAAEDLAEDESDLEGAIAEAIWDRETMNEIAAKLDCGRDELEHAVDALLEKNKEPEEPKPAPTGESDVALKLRVDALEKQVSDLLDENHALRVELESAQQQSALPENLRVAVGDVLAMSRKLTDFCEKAGIKPAHLRVSRSRKRAS
jgi:hypothetical protein